MYDLVKRSRKHFLEAFNIAKRSMKIGLNQSVIRTKSEFSKQLPVDVCVFNLVGVE